MCLPQEADLSTPSLCSDTWLLEFQEHILNIQASALLSQNQLNPSGQGSSPNPARPIGPCMVEGTYHCVVSNRNKTKI